jgi:glucokinase
MDSYIAVDVGGTQLRAACFAGGSLIPHKLNKISTQAPGATAVERLIEVIASVWPEGAEVSAIGVAAPGPLNPFKGIIYTAPNIPGWVNLPLSAILRARFGVPVLLGNDANLAALGEWKFGAGQGHHHLIYITVSTGIGGGIISDDRLLLGVHGLAAELGHITLDPAGPLCGCGLRGHLESYSSGTAIAHWVEEQLAAGWSSRLPAGQKLTARAIGAAAAEGDELAVAALARAGTYLGVAMANYLHAYNPSIIIFGGGVSRCGELLFAPMRAALHERVLAPVYLEDLQLTTAALGDEAGLMGALALASTYQITLASQA